MKDQDEGVNKMKRKSSIKGKEFPRALHSNPYRTKESNDSDYSSRGK